MPGRGELSRGHAFNRCKIGCQVSSPGRCLSRVATQTSYVGHPALFLLQRVSLDLFTHGSMCYKTGLTRHILACLSPAPRLPWEALLRLHSIRTAEQIV
jgi:hypothetical protein